MYYTENIAGRLTVIVHYDQSTCSKFRKQVFTEYKRVYFKLGLFATIIDRLYCYINTTNCTIPATCFNCGKVKLLIDKHAS